MRILLGKLKIGFSIVHKVIVILWITFNVISNSVTSFLWKFIFKYLTKQRQINGVKNQFDIYAIVTCRLGAERFWKDNILDISDPTCWPLYLHPESFVRNEVLGTFKVYLLISNYCFTILVKYNASWSAK